VPRLRHAVGPRPQPLPAHGRGCALVQESFDALLPDDEDLLAALDALEFNTYVLRFRAGIGCTGAGPSGRYPATLLDLTTRLPADLRRPALRALADGRHTMSHWLRHLGEGRSLLPEDIQEDTLAALVRVYVDRHEDVDELSATCAACGLERPWRRRPPLGAWKDIPGKVPLEGEPPWYDLPPQFFAVCPHCGAEQWQWTHLRQPVT
jgi:hypothetical protein